MKEIYEIREQAKILIEEMKKHEMREEYFDLEILLERSLRKEYEEIREKLTDWVYNRRSSF